ncbi:MAG: aspartyl-tRNA(Asn)/glutamyl-tRNA(Gln) amidotransferase subunit [Eubacteriaceae bacterium]|jgi:aspartyl-tRNA(Asn)/glutamyl-tRNA(Gln) amidotransferase subunit C|nr:aspartyl-tRNA(Asn)/glutamyl-tRNA(Gln) amidotransferase subunit [Eubacteriaceae bacterium]
MSLTREDVSYVADLARLEFSDAEVLALAEDLGAVLDYAETLNKLDTSTVKPTEHVLPVQNVFREDEIKPGLSNEEALSNAPDSEAGCFKVPPVLE